MLDWFSQKRMSEEQSQGPAPPGIGHILPDLALWDPKGNLFFLSEICGQFALLALPLRLNLAQTPLSDRFVRKFCEVRPEITRLVVVTSPEHLSTVVALVGNALILSDDSGEAVLALAPEDPMLYFIDEYRQVLNVVRIEQGFPLLIPSSLRPAA